MRSSLVSKPCAKKSVRLKGYTGSPRLAVDAAAGLQLAKPVSLTFPQYSRFFVHIKRGFRACSYERARTAVATLRLVPSVQHAEKSRMGKGNSKAVGFTWRGRPGDFFIIFLKGSFVSLALALVPLAYASKVALVSFY